MVVASSLVAQVSDLDNFSFEEGVLRLQKVFETELSVEEFVENVKAFPVVDAILTAEDSTIVIKTKRIDHDFKALGYGEGTIAMYIARMGSIGNVIFQYKVGRYRVTFSDITLEQEYTVNAGIFSSTEGEQSLLENYALKARGTKWRGGFAKRDHEILDHTYQSVFDLNTAATVIQDDDF